MSSLLYQPLESPELVTFNEEWYSDQALALQIFDALIVGIGNAGVKATNNGNLPLQLCREILSNIPKDLTIRPYKIRTEIEFGELHTIRLMSEMMGLIEQNKGRFFIASRGQALTQPGYRAHLYNALLKTYATEFNWAYRDYYPDLEIIQRGWLFTLYCLSLFGASWRPCHFYSEKFLKAFPMALNEVEDSLYCSVDQHFRYCYESRALTRFAQFWGLIDTRKISSPTQSIKFEYEVRAPGISDWIQFHA